ncbi:hypothetical protein FJU30_08900 [Affinibrenneria salicis]|uniref:Uncharacterized protein n=1 Tax=Affinibrenneria salicis TaxID=2590031 RepID=A0A5J5G524_9GAMM|nr:hypothetical protein [Affinibrenneria salicis]KAA9001324.1 hypothetical protein FJU30_08900 [Affinibrenneria salicis]
MRKIYDGILWLHSAATGKTFPTVRFSADVDWLTDGWIALTSRENNEIVVTELTAEEYLCAAADLAGFIQAEARINQALTRSDLRCVWLIRAEESVPAAQGLSFQTYRQRYTPPRLFYRDIFSPDAEARQTASETLAAFERAGGRVWEMPAHT